MEAHVVLMALVRQAAPRDRKVMPIHATTLLWLWARQHETGLTAWAASRLPQRGESLSPASNSGPRSKAGVLFFGVP